MCVCCVCPTFLRHRVALQESLSLCVGSLIHQPIVVLFFLSPAFPMQRHRHARFLPVVFKNFFCLHSFNHSRLSHLSSRCINAFIEQLERELSQRPRRSIPENSPLLEKIRQKLSVDVAQKYSGKQAAVFVTICHAVDAEVAEQPVASLLLTLRSQHVGSHKGQVR